MHLVAALAQTAAPAALQPKAYLTEKRVRARYADISSMTLWRWQRDEKVAFPAPMIINGRKYWSVADLDAFDLRAQHGDTA